YSIICLCLISTRFNIVEHFEVEDVESSWVLHEVRCAAVREVARERSFSNRSIANKNSQSRGYSRTGSQHTDGGTRIDSA
ncbi:MAG: hypothetical protein JSW29_03835, partial [Candidatus Bathyarchaeota archaeon]